MAIPPHPKLESLFRPARTLARRDQMVLSGLLDERMWAEGDVLFRAGDPPGEIHLVIEGRVEVYAESPTGRRVMLGRVKTGEAVGEMGVFDNLPRSASAMARVASRTLMLPQGAYATLAARGDPLALWLLELTAHNLAERIHTITDRVARARADDTVWSEPDPEVRTRRWWRWLRFKGPNE